VRDLSELNEVCLGSPSSTNWLLGSAGLVDVANVSFFIDWPDSSELLPGGVTSPGLGFAGPPNIVFNILHFFLPGEG